MPCPERHTKGWSLQVLWVGAVALVFQGSLEVPALVSEVYCVKNHVHLLLLCHYTNKLLARMGWGIGRRSVVVGLGDSISCACGCWAAFSLWCYLGTLFSTLHANLGWGACARGMLRLSQLSVCSPCFQLTALCCTIHQTWCLLPVVFLTKCFSGKWK